MRKLIVLSMLLLASLQGFSQAQELAQLALDIEKLAQFKQILTDLKKAYDILSGGYSTIKNIAQGNFNIHQTFLDGLLQVSPTVQRYKKIADIIEGQLQLVTIYKSAKARFSGRFTAAEFNYITGVYDKLGAAALQDIGDLLNVVTAGKLRMSDDERLRAIDGIYEKMQAKLSMIRRFNASTAILYIQRTKDQNDIDISRKLYNIK